MPDPGSKQRQVDELITMLKDYVETRLELTKLQFTDKAGGVAGNSTAFIIILLFGLLVIMFGSLAMAIVISEHFGKGYIGFLLVAIFYLVIGSVIYFFRDKLISKPVTDTFINKILNEEDDKD